MLNKILMELGFSSRLVHAYKNLFPEVELEGTVVKDFVTGLPIPSLYSLTANVSSSSFNLHLPIKNAPLSVVLKFVLFQVFTLWGVYHFIACLF